MMRRFASRCSYLIGFTIAACSSRVSIGVLGADAGMTAPDASGTGASGGNAGTSPTGATGAVGGNGGSAGTAGNGGSGDAAGTGIGGSGNGGTAGASGSGGTTGGIGGAAGTGAGGSAGNAGSAGGTGVGGSTAGAGGNGGTSSTGVGGAAGTMGGNGGAAGTGAGAGAGGSGGTNGGASGSSGGTAGAGGTTGDGGSVLCVVDQDCPQPPCTTLNCPQSLCALGSDGIHRCVTRTHPELYMCDPPSSCCSGTSQSCCHADSDCGASPTANCIPWDYGFCGGPPPIQIGNSCKVDVCTSDADCTDQQPNGLCMAGYPRLCAYGPCRTNSDCNRRAGGRCVMDMANWCSKEMVFCRYADDPCDVDRDCKPDDAGRAMGCVPRDDLQGTRCAYPSPPPP